MFGLHNVWEELERNLWQDILQDFTLNLRLLVALEEEEQSYLWAHQIRRGLHLWSLHYFVDYHSVYLWLRIRLGDQNVWDVFARWWTGDSWLARNFHREVNQPNHVVDRLRAYELFAQRNDHWHPKRICLLANTANWAQSKTDSLPFCYYSAMI